MSNIFDALNTPNGDLLKSLQDATAWSPSERMKVFTAQFAEFSAMSEMMLRGTSRHLDAMARTHNARTRKSLDNLTKLATDLTARQAEGTLADDVKAYVTDASQRMVLTLDTLRQRGDIFLKHEAEGCPPVLIYDHEVVVDGKDLPHPCNYMLLRILPPAGVTIDPAKRPYIIIDPRAGHGAGIGGFKTDSQVGVALKEGYPVYFVAFRRAPEKGQTLADVTRAEAEFVREVTRRHPEAPRPVVIGNCQGGWATLLLAASNPDLTGPIVLNGAPVDTWSGLVGGHPMRYNAGVLGGTMMPMILADIGHGVFDGAHLVSNFELLNPARTLFRKYVDLYAQVDTEAPRFLEFETWWGGYFLLNEAEIRWIVEQLFVGNRLARNEARIEPGRNVDLKAIRAPIIVFASHGDNITPPQQALNWITDTYADVSEIQIRGQRILYMVHDQVGHLGIFVSSSIAKKEHSEMASTMKTIEALAPGLYEMKIDDYSGEVMNRTFTVSFHERTLDDILALDDGRDDETPFAAVARWSEQQAEVYDTVIRPFVQAGVTEASAEAGRVLHPLRLQRAAFSSRNPLVQPLQQMAEKVKAERAPAPASNPLIELERLSADLIEQSIDMVRDLRDTWYEMAFFGIWGTPWARWYGRGHVRPRTLKRTDELRALPVVQSALRRVEEGGFVEAVIRMLVLLAESRGNVRRDRLERSAHVLTEDEPFRSLSAEERAIIIHEQTLIVEFDRNGALAALPKLLKTREERDLAARVVQYVPGAIDEMAPHTLDMLQKFHDILDLPPISGDVTEDPLEKKAISGPAEVMVAAK
jgi:pimeloyl-ACP methyl ester carboxylesterase/tellurite resistance protein